MTDLNLFDALETCLKALEQGAELDACLALFPSLADELRPLLTAAVQARSGAVTAVPEAVVRRGKARVLQAAAEMREQSSRKAVFPLFRQRSAPGGGRFIRLALASLAVLVFVLTGGTGLVNASDKAIPGDRLYPVKRSWEGVRLFLVTDPAAKARLEGEFDHERMQEIETLYTENRVAQVDFQGVVQSQTDGVWVIGGLNIAVSPETRLKGEILPGATVRVMGETEDGRIKAGEIDLLASPGFTPTPEFTATPEPTPTFESTPLSDDSSSVDSGETPEFNQAEDTPHPAESTEKPESSPEIKPTEGSHTGDTKPTETKPEDTSKPTEADHSGSGG
ncbi:MAG TPA: DUF5667 domain-containing protein [Anaerolineales bacterium]|jgi:hypothetical protein